MEVAGKKHVIRGLWVDGLLRKVQVDQGLTISGALYTSMFRLAYLSSNVSWTMLTFAEAAA